MRQMVIMAVDSLPISLCVKMRPPNLHDRGTCMTHIKGGRETTVPDAFGEDVILEPLLDCFKILRSI